MPTAYKTPGVYLVEKNAFPNSVVEVATAIPAFIGYTQKAEYKGQPLTGKPYRITSFADYKACFGDAPTPLFEIDEAGKITAPKLRFRLFDAIRMFFQNGGASCYIVSVGAYGAEISEKALTDAIPLLEKEQEPTLVVVPEAVSLESADSCANVQNAVLAHCAKMQNRFAILDVFDGFKEPAECIAPFREKVTSFLNYGAVYYPWLNTSVVQTNEVTFANFVDPAALEKVLVAAVTIPNEVKASEIKAEIAKISATDKNDEGAVQTLHRTLSVILPKYSQILQLVRDQLNLMPPSGAMAGIYTMVDNAVGVWKAPANVGVNGVISPAVNLTNEEQENLNVPTNGKAVNAIRFFVAEGNKVWGARTLDGNSLDWRYVNVRRTMIMLEESLRLASKAYIFEPNVANTWVTMKSMFRSFLTNIWKRGGLAGSTPEDAFEVYVGLGETMTADDILEGIMRITVKVALVRPAEFIEITFQQQQQKS
ncbi:MAG: phage tail sheath subtilisin-like domain-containing protein [Fibrobacteraceae bacterium]|nr:phage tail sheath subtilisin-like domain-containing protein [Fibrobacteraceae bacterium]